MARRCSDLQTDSQPLAFVEKLSASCTPVPLRSWSHGSNGLGVDCAEDDTVRHRRLNEYFGLNEDEVFKDSYVCALLYKNSWFLLQGTLYIFEHYICFASNLFGFETRRVIPIRNITKVAKRKHCGFPNSILIESEPNQVDFFTSFLQRRHAFEHINEGIRACRPPSVTADAPKGSQQQQQQRAWPHVKTRQALKFFCCGNLIRHDSFTAGLPAVQSFQSLTAGKPGAPIPEGPHGSPIRIVQDSLDQDTDETHTDSSCTTDTDSEPDVVLASPPEFVRASSTPPGEEQLPVLDPVLASQEPGSSPSIPDDALLVLDLQAPCSSADLFNLMFGDLSTTFDEFHEQVMQHTHMQLLSNWIRPPSSLEGFPGHIRYFQFRAEVKGAITRHPVLCKQVQRVRVFKMQHIMVQVEQTMPDLAMAPGMLVGDDLKVESRWDMAPVLDEYGYPRPHQCRLQIHARVLLSPTAPWVLRMARGAVRQRSLDEMKASMAKLGPFILARVPERQLEAGSSSNDSPRLLAAERSYPDVMAQSDQNTPVRPAIAQPAHHSARSFLHSVSAPAPVHDLHAQRALLHQSQSTDAAPASATKPNHSARAPLPPAAPQFDHPALDVNSHNSERPTGARFASSCLRSTTPRSLSAFSCQVRFLEASYFEILVAALLLVTICFIAVSGKTRNLISMSLVLPFSVATFAMTIDMSWKDVILVSMLGVIAYLLVKLWSLHSVLINLTNQGESQRGRGGRASFEGPSTSKPPVFPGRAGHLRIPLEGNRAYSQPATPLSHSQPVTLKNKSWSTGNFANQL